MNEDPANAGKSKVKRENVWSCFLKNIKYDIIYVKTITEIQQTYQGFENCGPINDTHYITQMHCMLLGFNHQIKYEV